MENKKAPTAETISAILQSEGKENINSIHALQSQRFYELLKTKSYTCTEASEVLGIKQKCLTRYKRAFEKSKLLFVINKTRCPITGRKVQQITANPNLAPINPQLNLF